ncbi:hypothetical protein Tco_1427532 [Tanacetum coccineum]
MEDGIFFNQSKYIKEMLKKFGLEDSKPTKMPMSTEIKITKDDEADSVDSSKINQWPLISPRSEAEYGLAVRHGNKHYGFEQQGFIDYVYAPTYRKILPLLRDNVQKGNYLYREKLHRII